jgi:hypothetical protein
LSFGIARYIIKKVKNWKETLMVRNKEKLNPIDLMLESISKIGDKTVNYTREELEMIVADEVIGSGED